MNSKKKIGIIGLGYVGLPLYLLISKKYETFGFDLNEEKIDLLKKNKSYISDISNNELKRLKKQNILSMDKIKNISKCDYIIFCLPTPLKNNAPDLTFIISAFNRMFKHLKKNQTIILESTVFTGATSEIFVKKLNKKFKIGRNFYLGYSPERIDPGKDAINQKLEYKNITKLVSGYSEKCKTKIIDLYKNIFRNIYSCKSIEIAETAKIFENIFRAVNIAVVNEMKMITHKLKLNIHDVVDAAASKPFGFRKFVPGPGVGGHCIPVDPYYMIQRAADVGVPAELISAARAVNRTMPLHAANVIHEIMYKAGVPSGQGKILFLGWAYKPEVGDPRESPAEHLHEMLKSKDISVSVWDPHLEASSYPSGVDIIEDIYSTNEFDLVVLVTAHKACLEVNWERLGQNMRRKIVYDGRRVLNLESLSKNGWQVHAIGRP